MGAGGVSAKLFTTDWGWSNAGTNAFKYESKNAFDGDYNSLWHSSGQFKDALKLKLDTPQVLVSFHLQWRKFNFSEYSSCTHVCKQQQLLRQSLYVRYCKSILLIYTI